MNRLEVRVPLSLIHDDCRNVYAMTVDDKLITYDHAGSQRVVGSCGFDQQ